MLGCAIDFSGQMVGPPGVLLAGIWVPAAVLRGTHSCTDNKLGYVVGVCWLEELVTLCEVVHIVGGHAPADSGVASVWRALQACETTWIMRVHRRHLLYSTEHKSSVLIFGVAVGSCCSREWARPHILHTPGSYCAYLYGGFLPPWLFLVTRTTPDHQHDSI